MVDQRVNDNKPNRNILSLPNLETKFVAANTLIPVEKPVQGTLISMDRNVKKIENELHEIRQRIFFTRKWKDKKHLKKLEFEKRQELKRALVSSGFPTSSAGQIAAWDPFNPLHSASFFDPEIMFALDNREINGFFDIIIGNPPYIAFQRMGRESRNLLQSLKYRTFESTGDIYALFYERGQHLLNKNGVLSYITSRQWMQASYGKSLRSLLASETNPLQLIDFGQKKIFEGTTVFVNILIIQNSKNQNSLLACLIPTTYKMDQGNLEDFFEANKHTLRTKAEDIWTISNTQHITGQIEKIGKPLSSWTEIEFFRGITSGLNEAFHIDETVKKRLIQQDPKNLIIIKPLLRGKDIKRYGYNYENLYTLFIPWHFPLHNDKNISNSSKQAEIAFKSQYPSIYNHLISYKEELLNRNKAETGIRYEWYALQRYGADFWENYEKPKIVWIEISDRANYAYDDKGMYLTNSAYFLTSNSDKVNLKYLLGILNSKVADFYFSQKTARIAGGRMRYTKQYVEQIPIPNVPIKEQKPFIALVNIILILKKQDLMDSTDRIMPFFFEHVIDVAVAELYFKEQINKENFEIIKHLQVLPDTESNISLSKIRNIYKEFNAPNHPIHNAVSFLKNYEPLKSIEESLNRKEQ
jgi:hypothetical protein